MNRPRVLDLGIITAGAATSAVLADLGAEVIKVESPSYKDPFRRWTGETFPGENPDLPPYFRMTNRSKRNIGIDLKHPQGRAVFLRLAQRCDIVVENFSRGVLARLGLDYAALKSVNPDIILASISSQGDDGPDARYVSFGSTLEAMAGLAAITGYADGPPVVSGIELNYPDQVVAIFAASMIATAWYARQAGGGGAHLDLSQRELTSFLCGEAFLDPANAIRRGNGQPDFARQDCLRAADGRYVAVSLRATDTPPAPDLDAWTAAQPAETAVVALQDAGIAAAAVLDGAGVRAERGTGWSRALHQGTDGDTVKGFLFEDSSAPPTTGEPASLLGTHTREILTEIGGYRDDEIDALLAAGAIAVAEPSDTRGPT